MSSLALAIALVRTASYIRYADTITDSSHYALVTTQLAFMAAGAQAPY